MPRLFPVLLLSLGLISLVQAAPATRPTISMTIYSTPDSTSDDFPHSFALVRQQRRLELTPGDNYLELTDLPRTIDPTSLLLRGRGIDLLEHSLTEAPLTPDQLLATYVGRQVLINRKQPGNDERALHPETISATLVSFDDKVLVLETNNRALPIEIIPRSADITEIKLMAGGQATRHAGMSCMVRSQLAGPADVDLTYRAAGIGWRADYEADLADSGIADLTCIASIGNSSGVSFQQVRALLASGAGGQACEFPISHSIDLPDRCARQVRLVSLHAPAHASQLLLFAPSALVNPDRPNQSIYQCISIDNSPGNGLGKPLPPGRLRLYARHENEAPRFLGERVIPATPREMPLIIPVAVAEGLLAQAHDQAKADPANGTLTLTRQIRLFNHRKDPARIVILDHLSHPGAEFIEPPDESSRPNDSTLRILVEVPASSEKRISYAQRWPQMGP